MGRVWTATVTVIAAVLSLSLSSGIGGDVAAVAAAGERHRRSVAE